MSDSVSGTVGGTRPLALVTGASSGIGLELARQFAGHGFDLLVCAEDDGLAGAAQDLRTGGMLVTEVRADLATPDGVEELWAAVGRDGRPLAAAALNAGIGQGGAFVDADLADELRLVDLNVRGTVHLARRVLPDMVARRAGRVLVTSSIASTVPGSYQALYNASKSFVQSFTEALQDELKDSGVTVTSLMPGPVETNFFHRAGLDDTKIGQGPKADPADVAAQGFDALMAGKDKVVAGSLLTKAQTAGAAFVPDKVKAALHGKITRPGSGS